MSTLKAPQPLFWRDDQLPHVELRVVQDGRTVCYEPHSHAQWSMGAITGGQSTFAYVGHHYHVSEGSLVFMNPEWVHACNPVNNEPWAYLMLYVDTQWLTNLRFRLGLLDEPVWQDLNCHVSESAILFSGFQYLAQQLLDATVSLENKLNCVEAFLSEVMVTVSIAAERIEQPFPPATESLQALAKHLDIHCVEELSIEWMAQRAGLSPSHLVRVFRKHFGMTPHAYQINRRIQLGQQAIRSGVPIADAALTAGFFDQPHFQRVFKRLVAATPGQYAKPLS